MKLNVDAHLWCLGTYAERYVPGGYYDEMEVDQKLEIMSGIEGLTGLFVFYPLPPMPEDADKLVSKLNNYGLKVSNVAMEVWSDRRWKHGTFCTNEENIRKEAVKIFKEGIDFAREVKADSVLLWPAHDGFDYPFQVNYRDGWKTMVETIREIGEHDPNMKIAIEAKSKDPRQKMYVPNTGKTMALINDIGLDNIGGALDVGHSLMADENLAESLCMLDSHDRLYQIHLNENYKDADPDMIFGTLNFWELLEFFYYLNKTDFKGWSSIDTIAAREDREQALKLGVDLIWKLKHLADKLTEKSDIIDANLKQYKFTDNMQLIKDLVLQ